MRPTPTPSFTVNDSTAMPLVSSIVLHGLVIAGVVLWQHSPSIPEPIAIQAALVDAGEFAEINKALQASAAANTNPNQSTANAPVVSDAASQYNAELAARQAQFKKQMAQYAAEMDAQIATSLAEQQKMAEQMVREQEQEVQEAKRAEQQQDDIVKQNIEELEKARAYRDSIIEQAETAARQSGGTSGSLASGAAQSTSDSKTHKQTNRQSSSTAGTSSPAGKGVDTNAIAAAIVARIEPNWDVPAKSSGERLSARVRVDDGGNVLSVSVSGGGNAALKSSLERAIHASSPLTPIVGTDIRTLNLNFVAN
ncbi:MAG: cell envelope integrity protein TolA [Moraxella sp.]|nr:cell envelope integrity protein TolA [Moraxella sp.]